MTGQAQGCSSPIALLTPARTISGVESSMGFCLVACWRPLKRRGVSKPVVPLSLAPHLQGKEGQGQERGLIPRVSNPVGS